MGQSFPQFGTSLEQAFDASLHSLLRESTAKIFLYTLLYNLVSPRFKGIGFKDDYELYYFSEDKFLGNFKIQLLDSYGIKEYLKENYKLHAVTSTNLVFEFPIKEEYRETFRYIMKGQYSKAPGFKNIYNSQQLAYWICNHDHNLKDYFDRLSVYLDSDVLTLNNTVEGEIFYPPIKRDWKIQLS